MNQSHLFKGDKMNLNVLQRKSNLVFFAIAILFLFISSSCQLRHQPARNIVLNSVFSNNVVLQQKQEIPIWGTADPGGEIIVELAGMTRSTIADTSGKWITNFSSIDAGGPYQMIISGVETDTINNVLIGEVWVCSGQSNMEMPIFDGWGKINNYEEELASADYSNIRLLKVEKTMSLKPEENIITEGWKECSSESATGFSAVGYFFGRYLHKELKVPIGLIQSAWGGTVVEAWTSEVALKHFPEFTDYFAKLKIDTISEKERANIIKNKLNEWPDKVEEILSNTNISQKGIKNIGSNSNNWRTMNLPNIWEDVGLDVDGVVWFTKSVNIPNSWASKDLILSLGKINDFDITWFNGEKIGRSTGATNLRKYNIPSSLVKVGENNIVVQVLDIGNVGGLYGPAKEMKLVNNQESISLVGEWKYKVESQKLVIPDKPKISSGPNRPTVLYNGMINPLLPYGIRGAIWYQGEANAERAYQYRTLFKSMINDWRKSWDKEDLPFLFVQLANFKKIKAQPEEDSWAELREAQTMTLGLANTGMAVTIDIGDAKDIHPKNKQDVGKRLALNGLSKVYGKDVSYSGPMYESMDIEGSKIRIKFTHTDKGLKVKNSENLKGFAISGEDRKFIWAKAKIEGDEVVVWNSKVKSPVSVRYAWAANPVCNLYNGAGLPASPFRTDNWEGITYGKK